MSIAADVYRTALNAVEGLDVRVLLTVGRRFDRSSLGAIPPNVRVEAWFDQANVLDQADLVVCHGGSGTAFGVPPASPWWWYRCSPTSSRTVDGSPTEELA